VGTAYVRWPDGHIGVLKWSPHVTVDELRSGPLAVAGQLRTLGDPAPATELTAQIGHAVVMVQELLICGYIRRKTSAINKISMIMALAGTTGEHQSAHRPQGNRALSL